MEAIERDGYTARSAVLSDAPAILEVLRAAYDRWPSVELAGTALEHLEWKLSAPGSESSRSSVATRDGQVAAALVRWHADATLDGVTLGVNSTVDLAVHPGHRRRGLIRLIDEFDIEAGVGGQIGVDLASNHQAVQHMFEDVDVIRRPVRVWARPVGVQSTLTELVRSTRRREGVTDLVGALMNRARHRAPTDRLVVRPLDRFDEQADALWAAVSSDFAYARTRDARYLNWRHADRRSGRRTILGVFAAAEDGAPLLGWAVLRPHGDSLRIVDLAVHPEHDAAGALLLERCVAAASEAGATHLVTWLPEGHRTEGAHRRAGFVPTPELVHVQFWITKESDERPELIEPLRDLDLPVHLTMADLDFY